MPTPLAALVAHRSRRLLLACLIACPLFAGIPARAEQAAIPFQKGERLCYQISWSFIPAGLSTLEVAPDSDNGAAYHFIMTARTLPAIDLIYKYRERVDSYVTADVQQSLLYKRVQESSHPRDIVVSFDWQKEIAQYVNFGKPGKKLVSLKPGTLDPLSAFYYIRTQVLRGQTDIEQWITDGQKLSRGKAVVIKKETITIRGKKYRTIKIVPDLRDAEGVFEKSPGAKMFLWLTDDDRMLLVKMQSKVRVGSFVAELVEEESVLPGSGGKAQPIKSEK
jgi:hypothetical protein